MPRIVSTGSPSAFAWPAPTATAKYQTTHDGWDCQTHRAKAQRVPAQAIPSSAAGTRPNLAKIERQRSIRGGNAPKADAENAQRGQQPARQLKQAGEGWVTR
ncbi:MAG: hypothetical protein R2911_34310 [Caldilineaceae bacterium]